MLRQDDGSRHTVGLARTHHPSRRSMEATARPSEPNPVRRKGSTNLLRKPPGSKNALLLAMIPSRSAPTAGQARDAESVRNSEEVASAIRGIPEVRGQLIVYSPKVKSSRNPSLEG